MDRIEYRACMCGRYRIKDTDALTEELRRVFKIPDWVMGPRYNVAPSQELPVVISDEGGEARIVTMRWGLVPFWDKSEKPKIAPINARAEEAFTKPMFRQSIQKRRALIPADGFYEFMWTALISLRLCASGLVPPPSALVSSSF